MGRQAQGRRAQAEGAARATASLDDRYRGHILRTPTEVRRARNDLLQNALEHYGELVPDAYPSTVALTEPDTFLMRRLCWLI